jgi:nitrogen regulatory protein PII
MQENKYELIIAIVNRGAADIIRESANAAGARGGTLLHGLGIGGKEAAKFLGIQIQPEKDIILMVVPAERSDRVMSAILKDAGLATVNRGICFSLPVDSALGLGDFDFADTDTE